MLSDFQPFPRRHRSIYVAGFSRLPPERLSPNALHPSLPLLLDFSLSLFPSYSLPLFLRFVSFVLLISAARAFLFIGTWRCPSFCSLFFAKRNRSEVGCGVCVSIALPLKLHLTTPFFLPLFGRRGRSSRPPPLPLAASAPFCVSASSIFVDRNDS